MQLRVVVKEGIEREPNTVEMFRTLGEQISVAVFHGAPVEVHLCNPNLQTLLSVSVDK